jgi:hypothetical protein
MIAGVTAWLNDAGLSSSLLAQERAILGLEPNTWDRKILEALSGAMLPESIGALFAGMNLIGAIPPYDRMFDAESLLRTLPFLSDSPFVKSPGMPPRDEWEAMATDVGRADEAAIAGGRRDRRPVVVARRQRIAGARRQDAARSAGGHPA